MEEAKIEEVLMRVKGSFRMQVVDPDGKIAGDTGWQNNQVTNLGKQRFILYPLAGMSGSSTIAWVALGTGTVPGAAATSLDGEIQKRASFATANIVSNGSTRIDIVATFASSDSFCTTTQTLQNIGLFAASSAGTLFAGNTYATQSCASNQAVNVTYTLTVS